MNGKGTVAYARRIYQWLGIVRPFLDEKESDPETLYQENYTNSMRFFLICKVYATIRLINPLIRENGYQVQLKIVDKTKLSIKELINQPTRITTMHFLRSKWTMGNIKQELFVSFIF